MLALLFEFCKEKHDIVIWFVHLLAAENVEVTKISHNFTLKRRFSPQKKTKIYFNLNTSSD